jgi:hypothetical protein
MMIVNFQLKEVPLARISFVKLVVVLSFLLVASVAPRAKAASGDLDPAFGVNGRAIVDIGWARHSPTAIITHADGKYLVSYEIVDALGPYGGIVRFNADHTRDNTWGYKGNTGSGNQVAGLTEIGAQVLAVENGGLGDGGELGQYQLTRVSRYSASGQLDANFGYQGQTL